MPSTPNASFPRRRHPTISLRGSSKEGQVELQETVRLKAKRDRDLFKRKRACNSHSTEEESVGNEQQQHYETASSISDQNHRRISTALRPWNITDEMIGATVPRKARSASVKRAHESLMEEQSFQSAETASPSSSNVSLRKKMKSIGPKTRFLKTTRSSSTQEDIEIEIAELLYGLRTSKNHESSSQKLEASDSRPSTDAEEKKGENYSSSSAPAPNNSTAESFRIESEQPAKMEKPSPESASMSGCQYENESKEDIKEENLNSGVGCGDTADGRSELFTVESPSRSKSKLDVDKQDSATTRAMCAVPGASLQRVDKFEIDLMAPPPMTLSPERDSLSRGEDKVVERLVEKEKTQEEIEEVQIKLDLENPNKHKDIATNNELEKEDRNKEEQPTTSRNSEVEKTVQSSSMPLSTTVSEQPCSLSLGYLPPLETVVKTEKTTGSSTAPQHVNLVLSQPRPKRCATHHYIARNIFMHQQCTKVNPFLQSAIGYSSVCDTKPKNVIRMNSAESVVVGKQSQKHSAVMNQNAAQGKGWAATGDYNYSLDAIKSFGPTNPVDSTQMKQLLLRQGPHPESSDNLVHGPAFLFPLGQHQASVTTATSQAGGVNCTSSASSSNKSHSSGAGSLGTSSLPAIGAAMSFSYPNLAANDVSYMTVVQNNGYPFSFSTHLGKSAAIKGASPAQSTPILNGPLYSSQMFYPLQHPQQHPHSKALVQPSYPNASTTGVSSSSHKQSQRTQVNGSNISTSTAMPLQQPAKQHTSLSHSHNHETGMAGQNVSSVASGMAYSQKNVFGQNLPPNLSFRQSAKSESVGSNSGNFSDRQQQQEALKGGVERIPSQAFPISFAAFNGTSVPSNLNFSAMTQNPVIFQSLPDIAWQGYQAASTSHTTQPKMYSLTEGKSGGDSSHQDDEKKATSGKPSTNGPTTLVFDNSSKNLNFVSSPMNGSWPRRSITSTATTTSMPLSSNASNSQQSPQLLHLQQQHGVLQQQSAMATRYKASSTNATSATKILNSFPVFSQNQTQCKSSNQASQSKNTGRTPDSHILNTSIVTSTTPTLKSFSQEQGRVLQGQTQISFGGDYMSSLPPHGQQLLSNNQPFGTTVAGTPPNGGNLNTNPQGSKVCSSMNTSQMHQPKNSSAGTGQKSSPVCGRNVPSILSACPSHLSEMKY